MGYTEVVEMQEYIGNGKFGPAKRVEYEVNLKFVDKENNAKHEIDEEKYTYQQYLKAIIKLSDKVCFVVDPDLTSIEALKKDPRFVDIADSFLDTNYVNSNNTLTEDSKGNMVPTTECIAYFELDYWMREFLVNRKNIYDFYQDFEDVRFLGDGRIVCNTLSHEEYMSCVKEVIDELEK